MTARDTPPSPDLGSVHALAELSPDLFLEVGSDGGRIRHVNSSAEHLLGHARDALEGLEVLSLLHPEDIPACRAKFEEALARGQSDAGDIRLRHRDGSWRPFDVVCRRYESSGGAGILAWGRDISARLEQETASASLGRIVEESLNEIYVFDEDSLRFLFANAGARRNLGYSIEELRELTPLDLKPGYTRELFEELISPVRTGARDKVQFNTVHKRKDGSMYPVEVHLQRGEFGGRAAFTAIILDTTTREEAEQELEDTLARTTAIIDTAIDGIVSIREDGTVESVNPAAIEMFGYKAEELVGRNVKVLMANPYRDEHDSYLASYLHTGRRRIIGNRREVAGRRRDGSSFPLELAVSEGRASGQRIFTGILRDLSEQKQAEDAVRRQAEILDQIHESVVGTDLDGAVFFWNQAAERMFEVSRGDALGRPMAEHFLGTNIEPAIAREIIEKVAATGHHEMRNDFVSRSGIEAVHRSSFSLVRDAQGNPAGVVAVTQDVTDLEIEQRRAREAEDLASISTLTAGIAHDIGTPMNVILGYAQMLASSLGNEKQRSQAQHIVDQVRRVTDLVHTLLNVARPRQTQPIPVGLEAVTEHALGFFREKLRAHDIVVERDYERVPEVRGDPDRLEQLFLNLFVNAADAMPDGGTLRVSLSSPSERLVEARVTDTGSGISAEALGKIFEPFFTTKARGRGNGLGLVVARGIAVDHGGELSVESEPGRGTEVTLRLPAGDGLEEPPAAAS